GQRARAERAGPLGLAGLTGDALDRAVRRRAADWSEVRPEWGLARNAAFVVAPRERTRGLDLAGRSFLHEYRWQEDRGFGVLELIMTAPMVVTHWINMQYYASTVDNHRYGSGNKVLHNVVGGSLGVFEGAGGDLRVGLALQSVHDGRDWYHEPLRLSVVIEAPAEAIDAIIAKHRLVSDLVANEWLFLYRIDSADGGIQQRRGDGWHSFAARTGGAA
ncbi:MAG TPA: putative inorganic carbon transporter subunit DabA, partial [Gemmatimonadales bacterium]|nr:putative inorganic carbon transporter subunit DabA [Gemmatimonadales bacterium]